MIVLAGDIGGTNIRLASVRIERGVPRVLDEHRLRSTSVDSLDDAIQSYLADVTWHVDAAGFGVAAPVDAGEYHGPNLPWPISAARLARAARVRQATLVNDFTALGAGIPYVPVSEVVTLQEGVAIPQGPIALIGAGTGLGEGFLTWNGDGYVVHPSEGGHVSFAAQTEREWKLAGYFRAKFGHVSYERILSGAGLAMLYQYLVDVEQFAQADAVVTAMTREDPAAVITQHAFQHEDGTCVEAVDWFLRIYGAQAGNLALTVLATGGVYVAGGIVTHLTKRLQNGAFLQAFRQKGRMQRILQDIPVHVLTSSTAALLGAAMLAYSAAD